MSQASSFVRRVALTGALSLSLSILALTAQSQKYSVKELKPHPGGPESFAHSINKKGNIVGGAHDKNGRLWGTFWNTVGTSPDGALGGSPYQVYFTSVNNLDRAAGSVQIGNDWHPVVMHDGGLWALPHGNYWQGEATGITDFWTDGYFAVAGRVFYSDNYPPSTPPDAPLRRNRAAVWKKTGEMQLLPMLGGNADSEYLPGNAAMSISNVAGLVGGSSAMKGKSREQAVVWGAFTNGIVAWLNDSNVENHGAGGCVNHVRDNRYYCGYYYPTSGSDRTACYWPNYSKCIEIGSLYGGYSEALAVRDSKYTSNNRPEIVGYSEDPGSPEYHNFSFAFRWNPSSGLKDLNNLMVTEDNWVLRVAKDIDQDGRIVGWGHLNGQLRGFLLTPLIVANIYFSPTVLSSLQSSRGEMRMLDAVPANTVISVKSSSSALRVPSTITVPRGQSRVSFTVTAGRVTQKTEVTLTFTLDDQVTTARLTINP